MGQFHFDPESYLESIRAEVAGYDELQERVAGATVGVGARSILELGVGTGETARRVLAIHPDARLTGIDSSADMLERARETLPPARVEELVVSRLEDPLPAGLFDLVVSALVVHHLDATGKRALFERVTAVLRPGGRFVLGDVVVPDRPEDAVVPLTSGFDFPDRVDDQLGWLGMAGFATRLVWAERDLAVFVGDRIVPPIVIDNEHPAEELSFYASVEALVAHLEPWYVTDERFAAYDADGRLLTLGVENDRVSVRAAEAEPRHATDLRAALARFLAENGLPERFTRNASLAELRREAMRQGRVVGD